MSIHHRSPPRITVGVDGSVNAAHALAYAGTLAERLGMTLDVVIAFQTTSATPRGYLVNAVPLRRAQELAREVLDRTIDETLGERAELVATCAVVHGPAGQVLVERGRHAQMLVVGARGTRRTVTRLLLGSVAGHCVQHAPCPVLVVPMGADDVDVTAHDGRVSHTGRRRDARQTPGNGASGERSG